jgi:hypothetical protein
LSGIGSNIVYNSPGPVASRYLRSNAFIAGLRGPIGSGKSVASVVKLIMNARRQRRGPDGWIRRRTAIFRNTVPDLKTTTIPTWHQWVPKEVGHWVDSGPTRHVITDYTNRFQWEVWFVGLDKPKDVKKVLSMELSDAWFNEARFAPKALIDALTGRVGRYPSMRDGGCDYAQILLDTNSPDTDHWWYVLAEGDESTPRAREVWDSTRLAEEELRTAGILTTDQRLFEFFAQPSAESSEAENLQNLRPGYYAFAKAGKTEDYIRVFIRNEYGFVVDGKPVYDQYRDLLHCRTFDLVRGVPLAIGLDFGLTPAGVIGQQLPSGTWRTRHELVTQRMGATNFARELKLFLEQKLPGFKVGKITGDPAGESGDSDEHTVFQILAANGVMAKPAPTNEFSVRADAVNTAFGRLIDGTPGLIIHPECAVTRKGCIGGYAYKRIWQGTTERYDTEPMKNEYSHPCEALQYKLLGGGEGKRVIGRSRSSGNRQRYATM